MVIHVPGKVWDEWIWNKCSLTDAGDLGHVGSWRQPVISVSYRLCLLFWMDEWWVPSTKRKTSWACRVSQGSKNGKRNRGHCGLWGTIDLVWHQVTRELGLQKASTLPVKFWQTAPLWTVRVATMLRLPETHTSAGVVRTIGAFDPGETGSILLCWEKCFDFLLWFKTSVLRAMCLIIVAGQLFSPSSFN